MEDGVECEAICRCGTIRFKARYRRPDEDVVKWLEGAVRPAMGEAHRAYNALCTSAECDLKLPVEEGAHGLGMRVMN